MEKLNFIKFDKTGMVYNLSQIVKIIPLNNKEKGNVLKWKLFFVDGRSVYISEDTYNSICAVTNPMVIMW